MTRLAIFALAALVAGAGPPAATDLPGSVQAGGKPVAEAVIWLDVPPPVPYVQRPQAVLDQRDLAFHPHVLAVQVGTTVLFPNHDRVFHDVFSFHDGKQFDLGLYPVGTVRPVRFDQLGLSRIFCNIHPGMSAYVMVVNTPYFAVTDSHGQFVMPAVPAGRYPYHVWRAGAAKYLDGSVEVASGATLDVEWP